VAAVRAGRLVVLPTDTVYGVGADAFAPGAVDVLLAAKGRGRDMPSPVLIGRRETLSGLVTVLPRWASELADAFWPGALTLILRHTPSLSWDLGETRGTVAVRMPLHPVALDLLSETGPMAVSSANRSGSPPATTAAEAEAQLGGSVAVYLDAGRCGDPVPSTIVDCTAAVPRVLRSGAVPVERLREVVPAIEAA
jgi:tRNA threonylcarbamoyl adenosine modification protein (Sua5/YciO/YrdC/YwlC family)